MKVYKFGGASVKNADGVRNMLRIVANSCSAGEQLIVVVSAMGKTTNALERIVDAIFTNKPDNALVELNALREYHYQIATDLYPCGHLQLQQSLEPLFQILLEQIRQGGEAADYDCVYDQIVSVGELLSTCIVSYVLSQAGINNNLIHMPDVLITNDVYREAVPDMQLSAAKLNDWLAHHPSNVYVAQGFIGGTLNHKRTTLGREGSDYSAALIANITNAESVTIWKDVEGVLNADPRIVEQTTLLPQLSYNEAVELAYSGAQIIHPKTIRPLENKNISLFVKPFNNDQAAGTRIWRDAKPIENIPVIIWRQNQVLVTLRAKDFSFVLEESLNDIFDTIHRCRLKVSLIQSSAVTISVCVDKTRYLEKALNEFEQKYKVSFNTDLRLLTIRGTNPQIVEQMLNGYDVLLSQTTRRTARFVLKSNNIQ